MSAAASKLVFTKRPNPTRPRLFPHLDEGRVFPTTYNLAEVLEGYETLKKLATSRNHIVPGHDPAVMKIYPAASDALKGLVIRLDVDPKV